MKVAIYTLTRDRLEYTKLCFERLRAMAGHPFDHFVVDNGSEDGTQKWLFEEYNADRLRHLEPYALNQGISRGSNWALEAIEYRGPYDLIVKFDNDCWVETENILAQVVEIYESVTEFDHAWILSPRVEGIRNQPVRGHHTEIGGRKIGVTGIVGGLFHCVPARVYAQYRYPEDLPLAWGQDDAFCHWAQVNGARVGYIEDLVVHHHETTDGQAKRFPAYFERKRKEEQHAKKDDQEAEA